MKYRRRRQRRDSPLVAATTNLALQARTRAVLHCKRDKPAVAQHADGLVGIDPLVSNAAADDPLVSLNSVSDFVHSLSSADSLRPVLQGMKHEHADKPSIDKRQYMYQKRWQNLSWTNSLKVWIWRN